MSTADSVFLKDARTGKNVTVSLSSQPSHNALSSRAGDTDEPLLLSSDRMDLRELHERDAVLKAEIANNIAGGEYDSDYDVRSSTRPAGFIKRAVAEARKSLWKPVIFTLRGDGRMTSVKTLGNSLPPIKTVA